MVSSCLVWALVTESREILAWCELGKDVVGLQTQVGLHVTSMLPLLSVRIGEPWEGQSLFDQQAF